MQTRAQKLFRNASRSTALLFSACMMLSAFAASVAQAEEANLHVSVQVVSTCVVASHAFESSALPVDVSCGLAQDNSRVEIAPTRTLVAQDGSSMQVAMATVNF